MVLATQETPRKTESDSGKQNIDRLLISIEDMDLFREASHDVNPLYCSDEYARKTPYVNRVCYGILGVMAGLGYIQPRTDFLLSKIKVEFSQPIYPEIDYSLEVVEDFPKKATIKVSDGTRTLLKVVANFKEGTAADLEGNSTWQSSQQESVHLKPSDLVKDYTVEGEYGVDRSKMRSLIERFNLSEKGIAEIQLVSLLWSSYLVGMKLPGRQALFAQLSLNYESLAEIKTPELAYSAKIAAFNPRYSVVSSQVELKCQQTLLATGKIQAMVRPEPIVTNLAKIKTLLPPSETLKGKVALITGASRGLGAIMAQALALQGCTVFVNFYKSRNEAEQLQASLIDASGEIVLSQGDAGDIAWCESAKEQIIEDYGRLDFLFCNAFPGVVALSLNANSISRINDSISKIIALTDIPMTTFIPLLCESSGWNIIISSISALLDCPFEELAVGQELYPHYGAAKAAIELLARYTAFQYPQVGFLLVRPPMLLTDLNNTYLNQSRTQPPEDFVIDKIINPLLDKPVVKPSGRVMIVQNDFQKIKS